MQSGEVFMSEPLSNFHPPVRGRMYLGHHKHFDLSC